MDGTCNELATSSLRRVIFQSKLFRESFLFILKHLKEVIKIVKQKGRVGSRYGSAVTEWSAGRVNVNRPESIHCSKNAWRNNGMCVCSQSKAHLLSRTSFLFLLSDLRSENCTVSVSNFASTPSNLPFFLNCNHFLLGKLISYWLCFGFSYSL